MWLQHSIMSRGWSAKQGLDQARVLLAILQILDFKINKKPLQYFNQENGMIRFRFRSGFWPIVTP